MAGLSELKHCCGTWSGTNTLHDPGTKMPEDSNSTAGVVEILSGRFIRIDYSWAYQNQPQEGSLLFGCDATSNAIACAWVDTWHMGNQIMMCRGTVNDQGEVSVRGSYAAPPGPDWGWRIVIAPTGKDELRMLMFNISPDGGEAPAVEAHYTRKVRM